MRLLVSLILRVVGVVALCLLCASAWVMVDVNRSIHTELTASAVRVQREAVSLAWREMTFRGAIGPGAEFAFPDWRSSDTLRVISPGYCVSVAWAKGQPNRLCGIRNGGAEPPSWFVALNEAMFGPIEPVSRTITFYMQTAGHVRAETDEGAAARQAWRQVSVVVSVAAAMAAAIGLLATLVIGHALMPAERIVRALKRLERGDHSVRLPSFRAQEFAHIARAFNQLTERLAETTAERAALTRRLFQVQEEERRALARDLHDEFGQCLTAAAAMSGAVAAAIERDHPEVAEEAREIVGITERMMATLRGALARLRPPDLDDVGLERSLDHLVATWNARLTGVGSAKGPAPVYRLDIVGSLAAAPAQAALSIYRIVQECLTNATRHGRPSEVRVRIDARSGRPAVEVTVEDDGGGDPGRLVTSAGHGLLGIRERIAALGGSFSAGPAPRGVRISALIPFAPAAHEERLA
ncbi:histidine kinase [Methylopila sp. M107]|uniref:histidine kinase n=1 Tax=Methylopila sp. M107 TaxID=1101190 RepID=UPI00035E0CD4|nr:histidine kinase [Methylopila sp. M107]